MLERAGIDTGIDLAKMIATAKWLEDVLGCESQSMVSKAGGFPSGA
jgi:hydroxymethylglutaryl-CoA lyase